MSHQVLRQMRNEAIDMLVLWAASKEYSPVSARGRGVEAASDRAAAAAWLHTRRHPCAAPVRLLPAAGDRADAEALGLHV
jgi:hypothetical protein